MNLGPRAPSLARWSQKKNMERQLQMGYGQWLAYGFRQFWGFCMKNWGVVPVFAPTELVTWWLSNPAILEVKTLKGLGTLKSRSPSAQLNNSDESLLPLESMLHPNHLQPPNHLYSTRSCNPMLIGNISHVLFVKYVKFSPVFMDFSMVNPWFLLKIPRMKTAMFSQPAANWCSPWRRLGTSALGWGIWR